MNHFKLTKNLDEERQPVGPHPVEMTLSPVAKTSDWGESICVAFEVEIMRGTTQQHGDGSTTYCFELDDEKIDLLRQALTLAFYQPTNN